MKPLLGVLIVFGLTSCAYHRGTKKYVVQKNIYYTDKNDERQMGELTIPVGPGPFPAVILVHGGGWNSRSFEDMRSIAESLSSNGFVVFNINYRLAPEHKHPAPLEDLKQALLFLKSKKDEFKLDPDRIGLWGYSAGGHIVSLLALTMTDPTLKIKAVVAGGAPLDFTWYPLSPYLKKYMGDYRDKMPTAYKEASPALHVHKEAPPFFLYHAVNDRLVEFAQSAAFESKLKDVGVEVKLYPISFWGHATAFIFNDEAVKQGVTFLQKRL